MRFQTVLNDKPSEDFCDMDIQGGHMNNLDIPRGIHAWYPPGQIVGWLQQQRYQVYSIVYDDQWYMVEARDPDGAWVELKIAPNTKTIFTWKFLDETCCALSQDGQVA